MKKITFVFFIGFVHIAYAQSIKIGNQTWMTENLNVVKFRNGDPIQHAKTAEEWKNAGEKGEPAWCYYDNNPDNEEKYGKLYNWYAVNDPRGLAPEGWKIPSDMEWKRLTDFLGGEYAAGKKMKSTNFWADNEGKNGNGTNQSGFSAFPGGGRLSNGVFSSIGKYGAWWSANQEGTLNAIYRNIYYNEDNLGKSFFQKAGGLSVRCLRQEKEEKPIEGLEIFTKVDKMPEFPGGEAALFKYLGENIKFPQLAKEEGIQGVVYLTFIIGPDGSISNIEVLKGVKGGCDEEAVRIINLMPKWKPGKQNGKPVYVQYNLPIRFVLK